MFIDFRLDQVEGEVFPAVLRFELGQRQTVLELACHLELKQTLDFSRGVGLCYRTLLTSALLRTRSATTSGWLFFHGEDIVKIEDSRPSSGHSSGSESISERSRGATPRQTVEIVWFVGRAKGRRLSEKVEGFAQVFEVGHEGVVG